MVEPKSNQVLSCYTTFGIGGPATYFLEARTIEEIQSAIRWCNQQHLPYFILGKGSNTLFDDRGFNGCVIHNKINFFNKDDQGLFHVGAGYSFSLLGTQTARWGWSGLEFASGIPGSVGGAVFMNAGANGRETVDYLTSVDFVDEEGIFQTINKEKLYFAYRTSSFHNRKGAIVGATFQLPRNSEARKKQIEIITYRKSTQPYGDKSAGCVFRNPVDHSAGALIDKCGLKGRRVGGAEVSPLHGNFIVNRSGATATDVLELMSIVRTLVKEKTGCLLETEVRYVPFKEGV